MNIKELKEKIANIPDHMDVFIRQVNDEFACAYVNSAEVKSVKFIGEKEEPHDDCFVLSDES